MNPARSFGPALASGNWEYLGAYIAGPIIGAMLAAVTYQFIRCDDSKTTNEVKGCC